MKINSKKTSKSKTIVALCALFTSIAFVASAICAKCIYVTAGTLCTSAFSCANGLAFHYTVSPDYYACEGGWQPGEYQRECFEDSTVMVTISYFQPRQFDSSPCPNCDWAPTSSSVWPKKHCWHDDTACGGNG